MKKLLILLLSFCLGNNISCMSPALRQLKETMEASRPLVEQAKNFLKKYHEEDKKLNTKHQKEILQKQNEDQGSKTFLYSFERYSEYQGKIIDCSPEKTTRKKRKRKNTTPTEHRARKQKIKQVYFSPNKPLIKQIHISKQEKKKNNDIGNK